MAARLLCIIAGQRSGTTAVKNALEESGKFRNFSEIFHTEDNRDPHSFLDYARAGDLKIEDITTSEKVAALSRRYIDYLAANAEGRIPLIDVKHNQWGVLRAFWGYFHATPPFLTALKAKGAGFLFISRRNLTDQILSEEIAHAAGKWHNLTADDRPDSFAVDIAKIEWRARRILHAEHLLYDAVADDPNVIFAEYEELFFSGGICPRVTTRLEAMFGLPLGKASTQAIVKNEADKRAIVSNYAQADAAVQRLVHRMGRPALGGAPALKPFLSAPR